ncbi:MAG: sarcosine oxidase subunit gamma SoxG [Gemmatimonadales bacterium]
MTVSTKPRVRRSPVRFAAAPAARATRDGWDVVRRYQDEGEGPWLVDLSHRARWDFQDRHLDRHQPLGLPAPSHPGAVLVRDGVAINRMNRTQVALWHLAGARPAVPTATAYTETTDGHCMLAFLGPAVPSVMEHLSALDLFGRPASHPRLTQGPILHVPCQVVTLGEDCVLTTFSRGYGQTFVEAALHAARPCGLRPAGEDRFNAWFEAWGRA